MSSTWILTLAFVGPTMDPPSASDAIDPAVRAMFADTRQPTLTKSELRTEYQRISRMFARQARPNPRDVTRDMVGLYHDIDGTKGVSQREKRRMKLALKLRMEQTLGRLYAELKQAGVKPGTSTAAQDSDGSESTNGVAGGATNFQVVQELITLIKDTIAPDSWDVRGGPGTIGYFSPIHALVIRANGEVHHQIGGTLQQVRRVQ
ncbi:MAG: hypothetical protein O3A00_08565 [Planctomycetota bacterium]|nr:hypothetical protein [Planctomycetota bacterium]